MREKASFLDHYWSPLAIVPAWGLLTFVLPGAVAQFLLDIPGMATLKLEMALAIFSYFGLLLFYPAHSRLTAFLFSVHAALLIANWVPEMDGNPYHRWAMAVAVYTALLYLVTAGALFLVRLRTRRPLKL